MDDVRYHREPYYKTGGPPGLIAPPIQNTYDRESPLDLYPASGN